MTMQNEQILARLDRLLDEERAALIAGRLDRIATLGAEKDALLVDLPSLDGGPADLARLRGKAERNERLMASALDGIRMVSDRLATMRRLRDQLDTYDQTGRRNPITPPRPGKVERRA